MNQILDLLRDGTSLMLVGMGIVFSFLGLLVLMIYLMTWLIRRFSRESTVVPAATRIVTPTDSEELIAVISAAVYRYRRGL